MSEYRPGRRRRRSRGGRHGSGHKKEYSNKQTQPTKPEGFLGWLKSLFGVAPKKGTSSHHGTTQRSGEHHRNGSSSEQRRQRTSDRGSRREGGRDTPPREKTESSVPSGSAPARRKAELLEVNTPRLYVGNLNYDISESDLFELFSQAAPVKNVEIARDRENERSKGFGFVEFGNVEDARAAQTKLNEYEFAGRPLLVSGAKAPNVRRSQSAGSIRAEAETTEGSELAGATSGGDAPDEEDAKYNR